MAQKNGTDYDRDAVREVLDKARAESRQSLTAPEGRRVCEAYGIPTPGEGLASTADEAVRLATELGGELAMKIVSPDILHKTEAGGVKIGVSGEDAVRAAFDEIIANAKAYDADAAIDGVQVQQMLTGGQEVIIGGGRSWPRRGRCPPRGRCAAPSASSTPTFPPR